MSLQIEKTKAYQAIPCHIKKKVILEKTARQRISFGVQMSIEHGIEKWKQTCNPDQNIYNIVKELSNTQP